MANISVEAAAGAGFKLIGQRPVSVFVWGLFVVLVMYVPLASMLGWMIPNFIAFADQMRTRPAGGPTWMQLQLVFQQFGMFQGLAFLLTMIIAPILSAAVYRAVLEPKNNAFAYLRLGGREVWLFFLFIAEILFWMLTIGVTCLLVAVPAVLLYRNVSQPLGVLEGLIAGLAAILGLIVLALRLSMAGPMTFAAGEFRFFQSWRLTRGHAGTLFLMALLLTVIMIGVGIVVQIIERIAFFPFFFSIFSDAHGPDRIRALFAGAPQDWAIRYWPYLLAVGLGFALYIGIMRAITLAPWAAAYRMLKAEGEAPTAGPAIRPMSLSLD